MSVLSAIVDYYDNGTATEISTLRGLLGSDDLNADVIASPVNRPYCILGELQTLSLKEAKSHDQRSRILDVTVAFTVFASRRKDAEDILEAIEAAYLGQEAELDIEDRKHMATLFGNRLSIFDADGWRGQVELIFRVSKSGN